jgi:hypothetical protein
VPPIIEKFNELGWTLAGRFLAPNTGSFWCRETGIAVASNSAVNKLAMAL